MRNCTQCPLRQDGDCNTTINDLKYFNGHWYAESCEVWHIVQKPARDYEYYTAIEMGPKDTVMVKEK